MRLRSGFIALCGAASLVLSLAVTSAPAGAELLPPQTPSINDLPTDAAFGDGGITAALTTNSNGTQSVTSSTPSVCTVDPSDNLTITYAGVGTCTVTAHTAATLLWDAADGNDQSFTVAQGTPSTPSISNLPTGVTFGDSGFKAIVSTDSDGTPSVTSSTPSACSVDPGDNLTVTYTGAGTCTLTAHTAASTNYVAADGTSQDIPVAQATPTTPSISNLPGGVTFGDSGFKAIVSTDSDGTPSVTSSTPSACSVDPGDNLTVTYTGAGTCTLTAHTAASTNYVAADGTSQDIPVAQATPTTPSISNLPASGTFGGSFVASVATNGDGSPSVTSNDTSVCTVGVDGLTVTYVGVGTCSLTAHVAAGTNYLAADGTAQTFTVGQGAPNAPTINNIPVGATFGAGGFTAALTTNSDGAQSVTSSTLSVCTVDPGDSLTVTYAGAGTCTLTAHTAATSKHLAADGTAQSFAVAQATPTTPSISNLPASGTFGGSFVASVATNGDGTPSVTSNNTSVCTVGVDGVTVTYVAVGTCSLTAHVAAGTNYLAADGSPQTFTVAAASPNTPTINNIPGGATFGDSGFTATLTTNSDGAQSVTSSTPSVCTVDPGDHLTVTYAAAGTCTLTAHTAATTNHLAADGTTQGFNVARATPTAPTISNLPLGGTFGGSFTASVSTNGDGTTSVTSNNTSVCTVGGDGLTVHYIGVGTCALTAHVASGTDYLAASGTLQSFAVQRATPTTPSVSNIPSSPSFGGGFGALFSTNADGAKSVTSSTPGVCTVASDLRTVSFVGIGTCSLTAHAAAGADYGARDGGLQSFTVNRAVPASPSVSNIPSVDTEFGGFIASVGTNGDGTRFVASNSTGVCTVGPDGVSISFVGYGTCSLTASVGQGSHYLALSGTAQTFTVSPAPRGYWLVGSDGGIFSFGTAGFYGSMGGVTLQRPVVGITPTATKHGYWLVASDGGIFSFGDSSFYGSIPGLGLNPAGSGLPNSLNAPIVGMVPSSTGHGYFMVASDGGVFAFGDARFEGSCPGIGGCSDAVAVMPDHSGNGYWLVTKSGTVYAFGDAPYYGSPPPQGVDVVDAVATPDGHGYWVLYANGAVAPFGDAAGLGAPVGYVNIYNPASSIFPTADGRGYWVAAARGDVFPFGNAPFMGSMSASGLNAQIIAAFGF